MATDPQERLELTVYLLSLHPADAAEHAAPGYDRARHHPSRTGASTGIARRRECRHAQSLAAFACGKNTQLYDNKICTGEEAAQCMQLPVRARVQSIGYEVVVIDRGDQ